MSARRAPAKHHEEEHEGGHERWLVTYADMITLLMVLFIVLFSMSQVDQRKFYELKQGLAEEFGKGPELLDGGNGLLAADGSTPDAVQNVGAPEPLAVEVSAAVVALQQQRDQQKASALERTELQKAQSAITSALAAKGMQDSVRFTLDERGLIVSVVTDDVLFPPGSAVLQGGGRAVLDAIGPVLSGLPNPVSVEGHTDDVPITSRYASNWELSTERATSVLRYLLGTGLPASRAGAAGFADQRPVAKNSTAAGRAENRRVEVVVLTTTGSPPLKGS